LRDQRFEFYNSGKAGFTRVSPISALKHTYQQYLDHLKKEQWISQVATQVTDAGARLSVKHKLPFGELGSEYPLMHKGATLAPLEFLSKAQNEKPENPNNDKPYNLIVFFAEGISARTMQPYSDRFPNLWPNVEKFSKQATQIDNYYSHAYATYRGLSGQLCSIYAVGRLLEGVNYHCLGHELKTHGYETHFIVSQRLDKTDLDVVAHRAGFDKVDGAKNLVSLLSLPEHKAEKTITDKEMMRGVIARVKQRENKPNTPFAMSIYNFETHTGVKLFEDNTHYSHEGIPRTAMLDNFHNFDQAFGEFWEYFQESPFYNNTVVVFTADHATFPSREYNEIIGGSRGYSPVFADKIPLLIYHPDGHSETPINAKKASAVNLVPTLLHSLNLRSDTNSFLGKSVFVTENTYPEPAASGGSVLWARHKSGRWKRISDSNRDDLPEMFESSAAYYDYIKFTQSLERSNKLVSPEK